MAKQAFIEFCAKASEDSALEQQLSSVDAVNKIVALGAANGFTFTEEDVKNGAQELNEASENELSEDQLTSVSGGSLKLIFTAIRIGIKIYNTGRKLRWW